MFRRAGLDWRPPGPCAWPPGPAGRPRWAGSRASSSTSVRPAGPRLAPVAGGGGRSARHVSAPAEGTGPGSRRALSWPGSRAACWAPAHHPATWPPRHPAALAGTFLGLPLAGGKEVSPRKPPALAGCAGAVGGPGRAGRPRRLARRHGQGGRAVGRLAGGRLWNTGRARARRSRSKPRDCGPRWPGRRPRGSGPKRRSPGPGLREFRGSISTYLSASM